MAPPKKQRGTRVEDQLHVGMRFPQPLATMMQLLVLLKNAKSSGAGKETLSSLTREWVAERIKAEWIAHAEPWMRQVLAKNTGISVSADGRYVSVRTTHPTEGHGVHHVEKLPEANAEPDRPWQQRVMEIDDAHAEPEPPSRFGNPQADAKIRSTLAALERGLVERGLPPLKSKRKKRKP